MTIEEKLPKEKVEENFQKEVSLVETCLGRALDGEETDYDWGNLSRNFKSAYEALPEELQEKHKVMYEALKSDVGEMKHMFNDED